MTPEQSKHIKPVDMAILRMIPQCDPDLTAYLNEVLRTNKPEQQNSTFWFSTPENPGKPDDHTPIQTRVLKEINELKDKEKLNPQESTESRNKFFKRLDWNNTLLTETEKQAIEDNIVDYHDIFARHRTDIGMNTKFKVNLTPKDEKVVNNQSLPMPIHLKGNLIVELAPMHNYGIIIVLPLSKYASPMFAQRKPNGKTGLLVDLHKINSLISDDYTNENHPVSTLSDAAQHLAGKSLFGKVDCSQAYQVCSWRTNGQWTCLHSSLLAELLPTKTLHKVLADLCLLFQVSCVNTSNQSSKLTNVLNTRKTLELQPKMLRTSPGTLGPSSRAITSRIEADN